MERAGWVSSLDHFGEMIYFILHQLKWKRTNKHSRDHDQYFDNSIMIITEKPNVVSFMCPNLK